MFFIKIFKTTFKYKNHFYFEFICIFEITKNANLFLIFNSYNINSLKKFK